MSHAYHDIAFTDAVKSLQEQRGSRAAYARFETGPDQGARIDDTAAAFIAARDSFYMSSTSETGWPYLQHRGGPEGFMRVLDDRTMGFADFSGNKQYVSLGNLQHDNRVALFFMDYANRTRLKVFGHATMIDPSDTQTLSKLDLPGYRARVERGFAIRVAALDWNCPQHITPRYTKAQVAEVTESLRARIAELEARLQTTAAEPAGETGRAQPWR